MPSIVPLPNELLDDLRQRVLAHLGGDATHVQELARMILLAKPAEVLLRLAQEKDRTDDLTSALDAYEVEITGPLKVALIEALKECVEGTSELKQLAEQALGGRKEIDDVAWDKVALAEAASSLVARVDADGKIPLLVSYLFKWYASKSNSDSIVQGIADFSTDYATRIQNFLIEYLGTPNQPVPFGGREADLARLNGWLSDPQSPPYLLLAAPPGRGKSALLAWWSRRLLARQDLAVVFFPVSIRFRTNLASVVFAALTARLATLHGDKVPGGPNTPVEVWRELMTDYLNRPLPAGRRLLLIVDGVDEASGWEVGPDLFSLDPPQGLRVVLSARYLAGHVDATTWLRSLGWDRPGLAYAPDLAPLTPEGVADVLRHMHFPLDDPGARVDIVAQLYRLSQGDPLLVRLYVDDLQAQAETGARLSPEHLPDIPPGLEGYFARWWDDQRRLWGDKAPLREPAVRALLKLLSCALGPLSREDVLHLAPELGLDTFTLEEALSPLGRFVIGDGRGQGYIFGHPGLGRCFYEDMIEQERLVWEGRFLTWGQETLTALRKEELSPKKVSAYVVQYYSAHLARAGGDAGALLALVSNGWRQAWEELEGSYSGFLNDVDQAWRAAEQVNQTAVRAGHPAPYLGSEARCVLCHASVNSLVAKLPANLLVTLVDEKKWSPAKVLAYARQMLIPWQKAQALAGVARHLPEPLKGNVLREAWETARAMQFFTQEAWRFDTYGFEPYVALPQTWELEAETELAMQSSRPEDLEGFAYHRPEPQYSRARALVSFASHVSEPLKGEVLQEALEAARAIEEPYHRAEALTAIVTHWPEPLKDRVLDETLAAVRALDQHTVRVTSWAIEVMSPETMVLPEALELMHARDGSAHRTHALETMVLPEALELMQVAADQFSQYYRAQALAALAQYLPEPVKGEVLHEALGLARSLKGTLKSESERVLALLAALGPYQFDSLVPRKALELAQVADDQYFLYLRAHVLATLWPQLPEPLQDEVLHEALGLVRSLKDALESESFEVSELASGVLFTPDQQLYDPEFELYEAQGFRYYRAQVLAAIGPQLPESLKGEVLNEAFEVARVLEVPELRAKLLTVLAPHLPEPLLHEAFEVARVLEVPELRAKLLTVLAPFLPEPTKGDALDEALGLERVLKDQHHRARTLTALGPYLPEPLKGEVLDDALQLARTLEEPQRRAGELTGLALHLPEPVKGDTLHEVLGLVRALQWSHLQEEVLTALVPHLPEQLLPEALAAARAIEYNWAPGFPNPHRARTLGALLARLPEPLKSEVLPEALAAAQALKDQDPLNWSQALAGLAPHLPEALKAEVLPEALTAARALVDPDGLEGRRAYVLTVLAPHLPESLKGELLPEAVAMARASVRPAYRARLLGELVPHLPEPLKTEVLPEALAAARVFVHNRGFQAELLASLVPHLSEPLKGEVLSEALVAARETLGDRQRRATALSRLAPQLAELPPASLYPLWRETLHLQATLGRQYLLSDQRALTPVLMKLGGVEAATETARAIQDVGRWWP